MNPVLPDEAVEFGAAAAKAFAAARRRRRRPPGRGRPAVRVQRGRRRARRPRASTTSTRATTPTRWPRPPRSARPPAGSPSPTPSPRVLLRDADGRPFAVGARRRRRGSTTATCSTSGSSPRSTAARRSAAPGGAAARHPARARSSPTSPVDRRRPTGAGDRPRRAAPPHPHRLAACSARRPGRGAGRRARQRAHPVRQADRRVPGRAVPAGRRRRRRRRAARARPLHAVAARRRPGPTALADVLALRAARPRRRPRRCCAPASSSTAPPACATSTTSPSSPAWCSPPCACRGAPSAPPPSWPPPSQRDGFDGLFEHGRALRDDLPTGRRSTRSPGIGALTLGGFLDEVAERFGPNEALVFDDPLRDGETVRWTYDRPPRTRPAGSALGLLAHGVERGRRRRHPHGQPARGGGGALRRGAGRRASPCRCRPSRPSPSWPSCSSAPRSRVVLTQERLLAAPLRRRPRRPRRGAPARTYVVAVGTDVVGRVPRRPGAARQLRSTRVSAAVDARRRRPRDLQLRHHEHSPRACSTATGPPTLQFWVQAQIFGRHEDTRMWSSLPMFWTAGLNTAMGSTLAAGGCWVMQETFEPGEALALMARERVTEPYTLPHQTGALEEHPAWATTDLSSLRCVYGKSAFARHPDGARRHQLDDAGRLRPVGDVRLLRRPLVGHAARRDGGRAWAGCCPATSCASSTPTPARALGAGEAGELAVKGPTLMKRLPRACRRRTASTPTASSTPATPAPSTPTASSTGRAAAPR